MSALTPGPCTLSKESKEELSEIGSRFPSPQYSPDEEKLKRFSTAGTVPHDHHGHSDDLHSGDESDTKRTGGRVKWVKAICATMLASFRRRNGRKPSNDSQPIDPEDAQPPPNPMHHDAGTPETGIEPGVAQPEEPERIEVVQRLGPGDEKCELCQALDGLSEAAGPVHPRFEEGRIANARVWETFLTMRAIEKDMRTDVMDALTAGHANNDKMAQDVQDVLQDLRQELKFSREFLMEHAQGLASDMGERLRCALCHCEVDENEAESVAEEVAQIEGTPKAVLVQSAPAEASCE